MLKVWLLAIRGRCGTPLRPRRVSALAAAAPLDRTIGKAKFEFSSTKKNLLSATCGLRSLNLDPAEWTSNCAATPCATSAVFSGSRFCPWFCRKKIFVRPQTPQFHAESVVRKSMPQIFLTSKKTFPAKLPKQKIFSVLEEDKTFP